MLGLGAKNKPANWYTQWREHPATTVTWVDRVTKKQRTLTISGKEYNYRDDDSLNNLQKAHISGELDLYSPIEAYTQKWKTEYDKDGKYVKAYPVGTPTRNDLPPVYMQWKQEYGRKHVSGKE